MALILSKQVQVAQWVCQQVFGGTAVATHTVVDALAAVQAVDSAFDTTLTNAVAAVGGSTTIINGLAGVIPAPWSTRSAADKVMIGVGVLLARGGLV